MSKPGLLLWNESAERFLGDAFLDRFDVIRFWQASNPDALFDARGKDVVATLTTGFIWGGVALLILERPGGGAPPAYLNIAAGADFGPWLPNALVVLIIAVALIWLPIKLSRIGLLIYAAGSDPVAAFRSGVDVMRARTVAYVVSGIACAVGGMGLTMTTGIGAPLAGAYYTLSSVAAIISVTASCALTPYS